MTRDARFTEYARAVSDQQLLVAPVEPAVKLDLVDGTIADELVRAARLPEDGARLSEADNPAVDR